MGFLDGLLFFPSTKGGDKFPTAIETSRSRSQSSRQSDIVPLSLLPFAPQTLEKEASHPLPKSLDIELARRLLGQGPYPSDSKSLSKEHALGPLDEAIDRVPEENETRESHGLDRYITAASKNPENSQTTSTEADTVPPSSSGTSRRARLRHKGSRGLAAVKKLFRQRRSQLMQSSFNEDEKQAQSEAAALANGSEQNPVTAHPFDILDDQSALVVDGWAMRINSPRELPDSRKVSDKTVLSESSDKTTMTVCRRPSKRVTSPITTVDGSYAFEMQEALKPSTSSASPEPELHAHPPRVSSSVYSDDLVSRDISLSTHVSEISGSLIYQRSPLEKSTLSLETLSQRLFSDGSTQCGQYRQQRAAHEFNQLAASLKLYPLVLRENIVSLTSESVAS
jgi:hypothetical protein